MKKIWSIRKDAEAVSPVIATILMVAITVVLAAVLYVMVLGIGGPGTNVPPIGTTHGSTTTTWTFTIASIGGSSQVQKSDVYVIIKNDTGVIVMQSTLLTSATGTHGFTYTPAGTGNFLSVSDTFALDKSQYGLGSTITLITAGGQNQYTVMTVVG